MMGTCHHGKIWIKAGVKGMNKNGCTKFLEEDRTQ